MPGSNASSISSRQCGTDINYSSKDVASDVIYLYCHNIILDSTNSTANSHQFYDFLERFSFDKSESGCILCCIQLAGAILKISNVSRNADSDENMDLEAADIDNNVNAPPLREFKPNEWETFLGELKSLRNLIIDGKTDVETTPRVCFVNHSNKRGDKKQNLKARVNKRVGKVTRDFESMDMFTKIFDDVMNFGSFLHAISFLELAEAKNNLPIPHSNAQEFYDFVIQRFPDHKDYRDILLSLFIPATEEDKEEDKEEDNDDIKIRPMLSRPEIMRLINERNDLHLERFRRKAKSLLQNWYLRSIPIPCLVKLGYAEKINHGLHIAGGVEDNGSKSQQALLENRGDVDQLLTMAAHRLEGNGDGSGSTEVPTSPLLLERRGDDGQLLTHAVSARRKRQISACDEVDTGRDNRETLDGVKDSSKMLYIVDSRSHKSTPCSRKKYDTAGGKKKGAEGDEYRNTSAVLAKSPEFDFGSDDDKYRPQAKCMTLSKLPPIKVLPLVRELPLWERNTVPTQVRRRKKFTKEEKIAVTLGIQKYGVGYWKQIKEYHDVALANRTPVQIKDYYRTMSPIKALPLVRELPLWEQNTVPTQVRRRKKFTEEEKTAVTLGIQKYGVGYWKQIKEYYDVALANRTPVQIKDYYRTMSTVNEEKLVSF